MRAKTYNIRTAGQANIPVLGLGTWQSTGKNCIDVVSQGLKMGYEHIDTAQAYDNEVEVGKGIKQSGVARDKFFLTTKIFPDDMKFEPEKLVEAAKRSLENLDTDYVDLLLLHWPDDRVPLSETEPSFAYVNWSAVKTADQDKKWVKDVTNAYNSDEFKKYAHDTFPGYKYPKIWGADHSAHTDTATKTAPVEAAKQLKNIHNKMLDLRRFI